MRRAAQRRGIAIDVCARKVSIDDLQRADLVLAMDRAVLRALERLALAPAERAKLRLFPHYCRRHAVDEVPDPYLGTQEDFEHVMDLLEDGCATLLEELVPRRT